MSIDDDVVSAVTMAADQVYDHLWELLKRIGYKDCAEDVAILQKAAQEQFDLMRASGSVEACNDALSATFIFLSLVASYLKDGEIKPAIDCLAMASRMLGQCEAQEGMQSPASVLAGMRHAENHAIKNDVRRFWRENIDPNLSAQKAANEVLRANLVPLSHKKIAEIISALRREEGLRR